MAESLKVEYPDAFPTVPLYHYTSASALRSVVDHKALWATHVGFMNDAAELRYAVGILQQRIAAELAGVSAFDPKVLTQLQEWLKHGFVFGHLLFTCSFTSEGNLLSQWRAYCPASGGLSLGFDPDRLVAAADSQGFFFAECLYDRAPQLELIEEVLRLMLATAADLGEAPTSRRHPTQSYYDAFERHEDRLLLVAARIKHPAFKEEKEWRAISRVGRVFASEALHFRDGTSGLIPYVKFELPCSDEGALVLDRVYVGPAPDNSRAFQSTDIFLSHRKAHPKNGLMSSQVPWRPS